MRSLSSVIVSGKSLSALTATTRRVFAGPLSYCLHVERNLAAEASAPHGGSQKTPNAGERRWEDGLDVFNGARILVEVSLCVLVMIKRRTRRERKKVEWKMRERSGILVRGRSAPSDNSAQMSNYYYHNRLLQMVPCCCGLNINMCVFLFHYLSVFNLLAEFKLSVTLSSGVVWQ